MPIFTPPSIEEGMPVRTKPLCYYRITRSSSVVRVSGSFLEIRTPSQTQLKAAGDEGTDYFLGGRTYYVTDAIAAELASAGFQTTADPGYGEGRYGDAGYGG